VKGAVLLPLLLVMLLVNVTDAPIRLRDPEVRAIPPRDAVRIELPNTPEGRGDTSTPEIRYTYKSQTYIRNLYWAGNDRVGRWRLSPYHTPDYRNEHLRLMTAGEYARYKKSND